MGSRHLVLCIAALFILLLTGCGSGGGSVPSTGLSGFTAAGAPVSGTVYLKDSSTPPRVLSTPLAADGSFSFDLKEVTAPFLLKAAGSVNGSGLTLFSCASGPGIANINPLSNLAVALANGSDDLAGLFDAPPSGRMPAVINAFPNAVADVLKVFKLPLFTILGIRATSIDFVSAPFSANHQGLDLFFDEVDISTGNGLVTIFDRQGGHTIQVPLDRFPASSMEVAIVPITDPGSVLILPRQLFVAPHQTTTLSAVIVGSADQRITWSVVEANGGSITSSGVYTAPTMPGVYHVSATSMADRTKLTTAAVTVTGNRLLRIVQTGMGVFTVEGVNLADVAGIKLTISYDSASMTNPQVIAGPLTSGGITASNTSLPGEVVWAFLTMQPLPGSGSLATYCFDAPRTSPGIIGSVDAELVDVGGNHLGGVVGIERLDTLPADNSSGRSAIRVRSTEFRKCGTL